MENIANTQRKARAGEDTLLSTKTNRTYNEYTNKLARDGKILYCLQKTIETQRIHKHARRAREDTLLSTKNNKTTVNTQACVRRESTLLSTKNNKTTVNTQACVRREGTFTVHQKH